MAPAVYVNAQRFLLVIVTLMPAVAFAGAEEMLQRMLDAVRMQNYRGVVVYQSGEMMETLSLVHRYRDGLERERMVSLTGDAREIHRVGDEVTCILPNEETVSIDNRGADGLLPNLTSDEFKTLLNFYSVREAPAERVAGRACQVLSIQPKDEYRYGYTMWFDENMAVPLKIVLHGPQNQALEQIMFTQISFPEDISDADFAPTVNSGKFKQLDHRRSSAKGGKPSLNVERLPGGFALINHDLRELPGMEGHVEHSTYSDGLASVSVFTAGKMIPKDAFHGTSSMGAVNAYGLMVEKFHVTVVGEVPEATVRLIGDSLSVAK